ncbi:LacI family DNA-binding transcriptional regulator [Frondihabitans sp. Leaf304]|uniref:LacI family DNA-binding transcriptional regulator n=1 Tax=Frondihabitans sp. Leaf304 TaxID=1736329 RepID=UPI0006FD0AE4|nr:LacI family DNA-binding transcriptional regulator [Frondihabitans sp. Leaf304]KQQ26789.1 LacI family transcriptional regulator [Frondihabitans sp. Leaf304]
MRATVRDVATRAGVSPKTVSNVVNGVVFVRPETRERVEAAVKELQYVPNLSARGLRNGRTGAIALAFPDLGTMYTAEMLHWFVEVAHELGWAVQLEETGRRPERERELLSRGREHLVDGLVLNPVTLEASAIVGADSLPPVVVIGEVEQTLVDQVSVDSISAARDMTAYLLSLGHRRIAAVGAVGPAFNSASNRQRTEGYRQAIAAAGLPTDPSLELSGEWSPESGRHMVLEALDRGLDVDAFFCFTDSMALGALSALASRGISVPGDVSVAGFDDIADSRFSTPPLTTVTFDKRAFADQTLSLLAARVSDRTLAPRYVAIPHDIVSRASTRTRH